MREILYTFANRGAYVTGQDTAFGEDTHLKLTVEPHDFSLSLGGETLRQSSFRGGSVIVSDTGEAVFYDAEGRKIARAEGGADSYKKVILIWKQDTLSLEFGCVVTVDNYPNCDGESDRWSEEWVAQRRITLFSGKNTPEIG